jgi:hypothetical protein
MTWRDDDDLPVNNGEEIEEGGETEEEEELDLDSLDDSTKAVVEKALAAAKKQSEGDLKALKAGLDRKIQALQRGAKNLGLSPTDDGFAVTDPETFRSAASRFLGSGGNQGRTDEGKPAQKTDDDPEPDKWSDPDAHEEWRLRQVEKRVASRIDEKFSRLEQMLAGVQNVVVNQSGGTLMQEVSPVLEKYGVAAFAKHPQFAREFARIYSQTVASGEENAEIAKTEKGMFQMAMAAVARLGPPPASGEGEEEEEPVRRTNGREAEVLAGVRSGAVNVGPTKGGRPGTVDNPSDVEKEYLASLNALVAGAARTALARHPKPNPRSRKPL